jgi:1-acyl-sn-glycerol-3-phosphate acyltransferase
MERAEGPAWLISKQMKWIYRTVLFLTWVIYKVFYRHRVYGRARFSKKGAILASNHVSNLDPPLLAISWFEEVHFLAKEELFKNRLFGKFISALNAHPISGGASDIQVLKESCRLLEEGKHLILFPEGQRSVDNRLGEIKPGIGMLVLRAHAAIVPAYIHGTFAIWPKGKKFPKLWGKTACVFGTPIDTDNFLHLEKKEAQKAIADALTKAITDLRSWYEAGAKGSPP